MLVVAFVSFSLFTFVGDPINNMVGEETSDEEREEMLKDVASQKRDGIIAIKCLDEGVDIPEIETEVEIETFKFVVKQVNDRSIQLIQIHII